uniref:Uncharacterized protein n=1 Tax=Rhizophora mucronata TaxID=61149 RepID=A0A2P2MHV4_RHIMU
MAFPALGVEGGLSQMQILSLYVFVN